MEQQRSEQDSSVGDALALALRCARFCSASLIFLFWVVGEGGGGGCLIFISTSSDLLGPVQFVLMTLLVC